MKCECGQEMEPMVEAGTGWYHVDSYYCYQCGNGYAQSETHQNKKVIETTTKWYRFERFCECENRRKYRIKIRDRFEPEQAIPAIDFCPFCGGCING